MPKRKPLFGTGRTTCCVMCDGTDAIRPILCGMPKTFFANNKKLTCQSKTMHAIVPYLYWPWWLPISDLVPCPIQVPQLVCVGNKECRGIMLENAPNLTSQFFSGSVKSYTACFCPDGILFWPDALVQEIPSSESSLMLTAQNLLGKPRK